MQKLNCTSSAVSSILPKYWRKCLPGGGILQRQQIN